MKATIWSVSVIVVLVMVQPLHTVAETPGFSNAFPAVDPQDTARGGMSEEVPWPKGGMEALMRRVVYPKHAAKAGVQGTVYVKAIVNNQGTVDSAFVIRSVAEALDSAAVAAVRSMEFLPAIHNGKKVRAEITVPIKFKLAD